MQQAVAHLLAEGARRGEIAAGAPEASGVFVLGMGKHGAGELNYSSDIDLIVLFDGERLRYRGGEGPMAFCVRLARSLVYLLETKNKDGYVFRTDLRLRPHLPGHPLALSSEDAELYYERHGQNWERAALIKARTVAGDLAAGEAFLKALVPFIWRKHLDYAAIRDIHSIKRQINAYRGFGTIRVLGHDLKVGRGGIREIEFFAQTQQLILGGREPGLRLPQTCAALAALAERRWIEDEAASELTAAYRLLRELEHRLQMVADRQTQALPEREPDFEKFAAFAGFADPAELDALVLATLLTVERHYAALFEREPDLGAGSSLVFTGTGDDPETLKTLAGMGFKDASAISARIRAWHHGHIRATRSTRARELLTELMPALLGALQRAARPGCRLPAVRRVPDRAAVRRAALLAAARQSGAAEAAGRRDGCRTPAGAASERPCRPVRRHAHAGLLRAPARPLTARGRAGLTPGRFARPRRTRSTSAAAGRTGGSSRPGCRSCPGSRRPKPPAAPWPTSPRWRWPASCRPPNDASWPSTASCPRAPSSSWAWASSARTS